MNENIYRKVNQILRSGAKKNDRIKILYDNKPLLQELRAFSDKIDLSTKTVGYNPYLIAINKLTNWAIGKPKKSKDLPTEVKDNVKTNNRIYNGNDLNYFKGGKYKPNKAELSDKTIKQLSTNLQWLRGHLSDKNKNRIKLSHMIYETRQDLIQAIKSKRGLNHSGNKLNEPSPQGRTLDDRIILNEWYDAHPLVKDLARGYNEKEIATRHGLSQATVSKRLNNLVNS